MQCTPSIVRALFDACATVTRAYGQGWELPALQRWSAETGDQVVEMFRSLAADVSVPQQGALQMFVDFCVLTTFLSNRGACVCDCGCVCHV